MVLFGLNYWGVNISGKPGNEKTHEIVRLTSEDGINCLDTDVASIHEFLLKVQA